MITDDLRLGRGGEEEKFSDNLAAIRTLKQIEKEGRQATPDEQRILARYVGWGGLKNAFAETDGTFKPGWEDKGRALADLLTAPELAAARNSTQAAHYTSQTVVEAMWSAVQRMGFKGGAMLEPSVGTGNFIGLMPPSLRGNTQVIAIEKDALTARIAAMLYPQSTVLRSPFEKVPLVVAPSLTPESYNQSRKTEINPGGCSSLSHPGKLQSRTNRAIKHTPL